MINFPHRSYKKGFPGDSVVKNPLPVQELQEPQLQSLDGKDALEEETAIHSSILAWKIPWAEKPTGHSAKKSQTGLNTQAYKKDIV